MVKAYLRFEQAGNFGLISAAGALAYSGQGQLLAAAALEDIALWNIKQGSLVRKLTAAGTTPVAVTKLAASPATDLLAAGYSDGTVRIWQPDASECDVSLSGHKAAVSALRFNGSGTVVASGGQDTDVILWDVVAQAGLFRLRGHHGQVTGVVFVEAGNRLVSGSKDGSIRVWDLATQHCSQNIMAHGGEVWSLDINPQQDRLATGGSDQKLRLYSISASQISGAATAYESLHPLGGVSRSAPERAATVRFSADGSLLAVQSSGRAIELYRIRSQADSVKHMKRRRKRKREKAAKSASGTEGGTTVADDDDDVINASDELEAFQVVRAKPKIRDFVFTATGRKGVITQLTLALADNTIEVWDVSTESPLKSATLESSGHRADVRALALSSDGASLLSASTAAVKVWNPRSGACTATIETGYGLCLLLAPGNRHAVVGTKEGTLQVIDTGLSAVCTTIAAHQGAVWSMAALPDQSGFVSGSADHDLKFWEWQLESGEGDEGRQRLTARHKRTLKMTDDVLCVRISPDGKLLAVALLDCTIKVFFVDSLRFFLSLYGHKLPVLSMDISSDGTLLASGSADKNLKIWGLDFGDCHRSLFAHGDSIMAVVFQPNTHYVFTAGKDKLVKYWDADNFQLLLSLDGHHGAVWGLAVSSLGDMLLSCGADRAIRRWERSEEPFFVEEEREARLESLFEADLEEPIEKQAPADGEGATAPATRRTLASLTATDTIADALEAADAEERRSADHAASGTTGSLPANVLMRGMDAATYVRSAVAAVKPGDLEIALTCLPFADALRLLPRMSQWLRSGTQIELGCRVTILLIRLHRSQLVATASARTVIQQLQELLGSQVAYIKDNLGVNLAAMRHLARCNKTATSVMGDDFQIPTQPSKRLKEIA